MKKLTIFNYTRSPRDFNRILDKNTLRVINVMETFVGIGENGQINRLEFKKLADALEPYNEGFSVS